MVNVFYELTFSFINTRDNHKKEWLNKKDGRSMLVKVCSFAIWSRKNLCALLIKSDCIQTFHFLRKFAGKETILMNQMNEENLPKLIHISETSSTNTYMHDLLARE